jgi:hypothetical protein
LDFGYTSKKEKNTILLGLKIKKSNKKMAKSLGFWVYFQKKKNPYSWVTGRRKTTKYSKSGNPLDKPTKTLYFRVTTRSKPMFSTTFLPLPHQLPSDHHKKVTLAYKFCESRFATMAYFDPCLSWTYLILKKLEKFNVKVVEKRYVNKKMKLSIFVKN